METQLERELAAEQEELLDVEEEEQEGEEEEEQEQEQEQVDNREDEDRERDAAKENRQVKEDEDEENAFVETRPGLSKVRSLPANFIYNPPKEKNHDGKKLALFFISPCNSMQ